MLAANRTLEIYDVRVGPRPMSTQTQSRQQPITYNHVRVAWRSALTTNIFLVMQHSLSLNAASHSKQVVSTSCCTGKQQDLNTWHRPHAVQNISSKRRCFAIVRKNPNVALATKRQWIEHRSTRDHSMKPNQKYALLWLAHIRQWWSPSLRPHATTRSATQTKRGNDMVTALEGKKGSRAHTHT